MENAVIIINAEEIPVAEQLIASLENWKIYIFDPVLVDRLAGRHLHNFELLPWVNAPAYSSLHTNAEKRSWQLERELDAGRQGILPEVSIYSWQHLSLYYFFMMQQWYTGLWDTQAAWMQGKKLHIFLCDNPAHYYFNSFVPALLLLQMARQHDVDFSGYTYGAKSDISGNIPDLRGRCVDDHAEFVLTHLPTCMYDMAYFNQELQASGKIIVNMEAPYFSMPVQAHTSIPLRAATDLEQEIASPLRQRIEAFLTSVAARLDEHFASTLTTTAFRERQVNHVTNIYRSQLLSYFLLGKYFAAQRPCKILLSDHDTGLHGPLMAFAAHYHVPVLSLPHAKTTADMEHDYHNLRVLTHPCQGEDVLDRHQRRIPHHCLSYPTRFTADTHYPRPIQSVALMLNAFTLNGVYYADYRQYIDGIAKIAEFCRTRGLILRLRGKPSYSLTQLLAKEIGLSLPDMIENMRISMEDYAASCDICIMYDTPTSGAFEFLAKNVPILHPVITPLTRNQASFTPPSAIPRESLPDTLQRLASFHADPGLLHQFKMRQFRNYLNLFEGAQALRVFV